MEIGISNNRNSNSNMCDGAKDKGGQTAIYRKVLPHEINLESISADTDSDYDSDRNNNDCCDSYMTYINVHLHCSDGVYFHAQPFGFESTVVLDNIGIKEVESDSKTLEMVKVFCEGRAKIMMDDYAEIKDYYAAEEFFHNKLNEFNSEFLQDHRSYAKQLITAAFELEIIRLIRLMMEEVVNLFTTKMTEDEVYNFFFVNLKEFREDKFEVMKHDLLNCLEFFDTSFIDYRDIVYKRVIDVRAANNIWDSDLLKEKFHSLETYHQRRQWLKAHFLLRRPHLAKYYGVQFKEAAAADEDEKYKMTHISQMEFGISDRNANMCVGAKDKRKTAIDDCKISKKARYMQHHEFSYRGWQVTVLHLHCSDGVPIDAEPFKIESRVVRMRYNYNDFGIEEVESDSKTLEMVKVFCEGRGKILDDDYAAEKENFDKLNEFNSEFLQDYRSYAKQLITAAFELEIISLIHLMMEEVVNLFTTKMTEDEVYNYFFVNLREYREDIFNAMKHDLLNCREFFDTNFIDYHDIVSNGVMDVRATNYWDSNLLKEKFHSLEAYEQQRQWVTAHFLLKRPRLAYFYRFLLGESAADKEDEER